jgi:hypothetical protein
MTDETTAAGAFAPLSPPGGQRFWITPDMLHFNSSGSERPTFSTSVVATAFFGRSSAWLRVRMRPSGGHPHGELVLDGQPLEIRRSAADDRRFSLRDIEMAAHALRQNDAIDDKRLSAVLAMVVSCAVAYGMMSPPWEVPK